MLRPGLCVSRNQLLMADSGSNPFHSSFLLQHPWPFESPCHSLVIIYSSTSPAPSHRTGLDRPRCFKSIESALIFFSHHTGRYLISSCLCLIFPALCALSAFAYHSRMFDHFLCLFLPRYCLNHLLNFIHLFVLCLCACVSVCMCLSVCLPEFV